MAEPLQYSGGTFNSLCHINVSRAWLLGGVLREFLLWHFAASDNVEQLALRQVIWSPDAAECKIAIEMHGLWRPETSGNTPAIVIKRNAYQSKKMGIGDVMQGPSIDLRGDQHYMTQWTGSHTLFCVGGSAEQADALASEVQREISQFGPQLRKCWGLHKISVVQVGAVAQLQEARQNMVVPVVVGYMYMDDWSLAEQAPVLRQVSHGGDVFCS